MSSLTVEQRMDRLESIESIRQLKARYCAGCDDDHNPELLGTLFHADATWEASGIGRFEGIAAIKSYFQQLRDSGRLRNSAHNAINPDITVDADTASGHWRLIMLYTANLPDGEAQYFRIIGWYRETYRRADGEWRFQSLYCEVEEHAPYAIEDLIEKTRG